jgi:8-oxo-dGTP pyrophosphatase MutT (NUDIX family)
MQVREYSAAGGVVLDDAGQVLLLERWVQREARLIHEIRLPKGHVEPGETDEQAALRETCEESGYCGLEIIADLGAAYTQFIKAQERVARTERYFLMRLVHPAQGTPEFHGADEALFRVRWVANLEVAEAQLTYESEKQFARRARAHLATLPATQAGS